MDKDIKEDKKQLFNKLLVLYNKVLRGLKDKVVILKAGEDNNLWFNNIKVLYSTILGDPHQNISEKEPIATHLVPNSY